MTMSTLWSFDGTEHVACEVARPDTYARLLAEIDSSKTDSTPIIALGSGLSYCHAGAGTGVRSLSTRHFDRILAFDTASGIITIEPGVRLGELVAVALRHGWYPPVLPGHPQITVGGCVGFNVHGKSQFHSGCFSSCVTRLQLYHPDHGYQSCGPEEQPELFAMTVGGFGLTGFMTSISLQLVRLAGRSLHREAIPVAGLTASVAAMERHEATADAVYSWNDLTRRGAAFGRGVVYLEHFSDEEVPWRGRYHFLDAQLRRRLPVSLLNRISIPLMHLAYRFSDRLRGRESWLSIEQGTFPIAGKEIYYQLFGRRGLREYQALVPRSAWDELCKRVQLLLRVHQVKPTLGSLKLFRGESSLLHFDGCGVCLTIDAVADRRTLALFESLDRLVLELGGLVNLSKDSRVARSTVSAMFPEYERFRGFLRQYDPKSRFSSELRRRILD